MSAAILLGSLRVFRGCTGFRNLALFMSRKYVTPTLHLQKDVACAGKSAKYGGLFVPFHLLAPRRHDAERRNGTNQPPQQSAVAVLLLFKHRGTKTGRKPEPPVEST